FEGLGRELYQAGGQSELTDKCRGAAAIRKASKARHITGMPRARKSPAGLARQRTVRIRPIALIAKIQTTGPRGAAECGKKKVSKDRPNRKHPTTMIRRRVSRSIFFQAAFAEPARLAKSTGNVRMGPR